MNRWQVLQGDCRVLLATLDAESVQCVVTSPPYFGLRDYGTAQWDGGDAECTHLVGGQVPDSKAKGAIVAGVRPGVDASFCRLCGAARVDSQIGLEQTPDEYVAQMVAVFREIRRVLHPTGVAFLNLGDSFAGSWGNQGRKDERGTQRPINGPMLQNLEPYPAKASNTGRIPDGSGLKPKDLMGIPWRVAFALQADGWWLRSDIVWAKKAPMPESVTDRPTRSHEFVFLLTKSASYFYDADAIREPSSGVSGGGWSRAYAEAQPSHGAMNLTRPADTGGRNRRDVWLLGPESSDIAHFAVMPSKLVEPCILAGTSDYGCCADCGAPWQRVTERTASTDESYRGSSFDAGKTGVNGMGRVQSGERFLKRSTGWEPTCGHDADVVPCTVLDPFAGSGTTLSVAKRLNRDAVGLELNPEYVELCYRRLDAVTVPLPLHTAQEHTA